MTHHRYVPDPQNLYESATLTGDGLMDLDAARGAVRRRAAMTDGDPIYDALIGLGKFMATQLAKRPSRDLEAASDTLIEAGAVLGGIVVGARSKGATLPPEALLNITGSAAVELHRIAQERGAADAD